jgi:DNA (cytosine-5)-methyltransferase 3A
MKVLSLFDGISCGMVALERAGINVDKYVAYEIDENAITVSKNNYPTIEHRGNVVKADFTEFKGFDMIIAGFPCQDLSISKKDRQGLKGKRSGLFWELVRAIEEVKPRYFLVENNYKMPKEDEAIITETLGVKSIMINSALLSGQTRKRLYWTNIATEIPQDKKIVVKDIITNEKREDLTSFTIFNANLNNKEYLAAPRRIGTIGKGGQGERVYSLYGKSVTIKANGGGRGAKTGLYLIGDTVRKLTPLECERLQTLPDNYTAGLSDTARVKAIGNGWTVDVIAHILKGLKNG